MSFEPRPTHDPLCHTTREWVGPFPVSTTQHHEGCVNRVDDDRRPR